jgi:hypothetical protein
MGLATSSNKAGYRKRFPHVESNSKVSPITGNRPKAEFQKLGKDCTIAWPRSGSRSAIAFGIYVLSTYR